MSRGEETDEPITGDDHFTVVISGDGSATIDDVPVRVPEGQTADAAILDALHGYARDRNTAVTAAISDPSADYMAYVEVAPDGSSRLLGQREEQPGQPETPAEADFDPDDEPDDAPDDEPDDELDDEPDEPDELDEATYALPEPPEPTPLPAHSPVPVPVPDTTPPPPLTRTPPAPLIRRLDRRNESRQSDDEYEPSGLLHRPLVVGPVAIAVASLVVVSLVMLGSSESSGGDDKKETARSSSELSKSPTVEEQPAPTFSVSVSPPPPPSETPASPSATPKKSPTTKAGGVGGAGGTTVTVTATPPRATSTVTAKPAADTAATAVKRLGQRDPSGRHICYRAFVSGQGWQKPVCDGTLAGTTGQNKPIKALNIAVYGTGGSAANAVLHDPRSSNGQGKWYPNWTAITADGKNFYIGSTKASVKYMTGFAINIGSGRVCQTAKVSGHSWGNQGCADRRPDYIFGGTMENTHWLEAVKFTV